MMAVMQHVTHVIGRNCPPAVERRLHWGQNLTEALEAQGLTVKRLHRLLVDDGVDVSIQTVYAWRAGSWAPTVEHQAAIARVLGTRAHLLFPASAA